jgi:hypothetical protein
MEAKNARRMWRGLEPLHGMIYFVPEGREEYEAVGLKGSRMGYFASRGASLGPVPADVIIATFFNFHPELVRRVIPDAWSMASPGDILGARFQAVDRALRRLLGDDIVADPTVAEAEELARRATEGCFPQGRPLYAGHASIPWPAEPHVRLWHAISLLREFRGDGHVAALVSAGVGPCEALIFHGATGQVPKELLQQSRAWPDDEWDATEASLRDRGLLAADGTFTADGAALHQHVEDTTDQRAMAPWEHLGADGCERLLELGRPLSKLVVENGGVPTR